jgi:hypothetical protein
MGDDSIKGSINGSENKELELGFFYGDVSNNDLLEKPILMEDRMS